MAARFILLGLDLFFDSRMSGRFIRCATVSAGGAVLVIPVGALPHSGGAVLVIPVDLLPHSGGAVFVIPAGAGSAGAAFLGGAFCASAGLS